MEDRPSKDTEGRLLDIDPSAHPAPGTKWARRLRDVLKKLVRPDPPRPDPRGPRKKIDGPGPVHRD